MQEGRAAARKMVALGQPGGQGGGQDASGQVGFGLGVRGAGATAQFPPGEKRLRYQDLRIHPHDGPGRQVGQGLPEGGYLLLRLWRVVPGISPLSPRDERLPEMGPRRSGGQVAPFGGLWRLDLRRPEIPLHAGPAVGRQRRSRSDHEGILRPFLRDCGQVDALVLGQA